MRLAKAWCFQFQCVGLHYMCVPLCFRATQRILQVNVTVDLIPHLQIFLPADSDFCVQSWMTSGEKLLDLNVGGVMRVCALERGMGGSNYLLVFSSLNWLKSCLSVFVKWNIISCCFFRTYFVDVLSCGHFVVKLHFDLVLGSWVA